MIEQRGNDTLGRAGEMVCLLGSELACLPGWLSTVTKVQSHISGANRERPAAYHIDKSQKCRQMKRGIVIERLVIPCFGQDVI